MVAIPDPTLRKLAATFSTPLYIYDAEVIAEQYYKLGRALTDECDIYYSLKANPNVSICRLLRRIGAGAEICSLTELETAALAGFAPEKMIYVGPAKTADVIQKCLALGVYAIVCESAKELSLISTFAQRQGCVAPVLLRINSKVKPGNASLSMAGLATQFGIDECELFDNRQFYFEQPNVKILGPHTYYGTRILNPKTVIKNTIYSLNLAQQIAELMNTELSCVDIGGGIGVPYFANETEFDIQQFGDELRPLLADFTSKYPHTRLIIESGRYIIADAGVLLGRVIDVKCSKGEWFCILDCGTNCYATTQYHSMFQNRHLPIRVIKTQIEHTTEQQEYHLVGPLCTPTDVLAKHVMLPNVEPGDLIAIERAGAYGLTASPVMFLSHGYPAEVLIHNRNAYLIRRPQLAQDILNAQTTNFVV